VAAAKSARMNAGMAATFPLPPCSSASLDASAAAAGRGRPRATSEEVILDRNSLITIVPKMAKPRLAP
jgi:hypothetical protein